MRDARRSVGRLLGRAPVHPVLVAAAIVMLVWATEAGEVVPGSAVPALLVAMAVGALLTVIGRLVMGDGQRGAMVATAGTLFVLAHGFLWPAPLLGWPGLVVSLLVVAVAAWRMHLVDEEVVHRMTWTANLVGIAAVGTCTAVIVAAGTPAEASRLEATVPASDPAEHRDLVWIVPDRYGGQAGLRTRFQIDDAGLGESLERRGFVVGSDVRANYPRTTHSLASQWNLALLDDAVDALPGSAAGAVTPLYPLLSDHATGRLLTERGYSYTHLGSWFGPTVTAETADDTRRVDERSEFGLVIEWSSVLPVVRGSDEVGVVAGRRARQLEVTSNQLDELEAVAQVLADDRDDAPRLVVAHVSLPHEPFVFRADGAVVPAEEQASRTYGDSYDAQLRYFNERVVEVVDILLAGTDDRSAPVILIQADEGPHPLGVLSGGAWSWPDASDGELVTKFSILSALYAPGSGGEVPAGTTAVNVARRAVGAALGVEVGDLPDRSFVNVDERDLYRFVDVTDRLDAALDGEG